MMTGPTPHKVVCLSFIDEKVFREKGGGVPYFNLDEAWEEVEKGMYM